MQTMYLILVEKSGAEDGLSSVELMFYNSVLSLPFLFFIIIATGEFPYSLSVLSEKVSSTNTGLSNLSRTSKIAICFAVLSWIQFPNLHDWCHLQCRRPR